jgi:Family of unknown function (DUF6286)
MHFLPVFTRILSVLLALALIVAGVIAVVEVFAAWLGAGWTLLPDAIVSRFQHWHWDDGPVVITIVVVGVVGLVALLVGLWPRPPLTVPVDGQPDVTYERHGLEQSIRRQIEVLDGVAKARVRIDGRRLRTRVETSRRHQPEELKARVDERLASVTSSRHLNLRPDVRLRFPGGTRRSGSATVSSPSAGRSSSSSVHFCWPAP